jgi:hypothetical protein
MNIGPYLKTIAGFVGGVVINIAYRLVEDTSALPALDDGKGWLLLVITTAAATAGVYGTPNPGYIKPKAGHTAVVYEPGQQVELPPQGPLPEVVTGRTPGGRHAKADHAAAGEATRRPRRRLF